jgi:hypothetical protein
MAKEEAGRKPKINLIFDGKEPRLHGKSAILAGLDALASLLVKSQVGVADAVSGFVT